MALEQKAVLKIMKEKDGKHFSFEMDLGSPYGLCYDVLFEMLQEITHMSKDAVERAKRDEASQVEEAE